MNNMALVAHSREVAEEGLSGIAFIPSVTPYPGVVVLGGSDGRMKLAIAERLAGVGIAAFALDYWPREYTPLSDLPIENVERACRWLLAQPGVIGDRVGLVGQSKGAELALVVASSYPDLVGPTIAVAPSAVVWYGIDQTQVPPMLAESSWSHRGVPLPYVAMSTAKPTMSERGMALRPTFEAGLDDLEAVRRAVISVELATGPIMLLSGGDDQMWPSARMAGMVADRMAAHGRAADISTVTYESAGHSLLVSAAAPTIDPGERAGLAFDLGGSDEVNAAAGADAEVRISEFFQVHLARPTS
ncbi:MAG: acyl-CoA thioester hydrolase/BAAT C-terminal domain-containing protein [Candidatus Dormibacteria bacterium]